MNNAILRLFAAFGIIGVALSTLWCQTNVRITTKQLDQSEATMAVSPINSRYMMAAWNDNSELDAAHNFQTYAGYSFSTDGGVTWESSNLKITGQLYPDGADPSVAFDRQGHAFYTYIGKNNQGTPQRICVTRFTVPSFAVEGTTPIGSTPTNCDKPYMALDNSGHTYDGQIFVTWVEGRTQSNDTSTIWFARLDSAGNHVA